MFFGRKNSKDAAASTDTNTIGNLRGDVLKLLWLAATILVLISLVSYSPIDPSWSTFSTKNDFRNWAGRTGSVVSDFLYQSFGLGAFAIVLLLSFYVYSRANNKQNDEDSGRLTYALPLLFLVFLSSFIQNIFPVAYTPWQLPNPGGYFGRLMADLLDYLTGPFGTRFLSGFFTLITGVIVFQSKIISTTIHFLKKMPSMVHAKYTSLALFKKKSVTPPIAVSAPITIEQPKAEKSEPHETHSEIPISVVKEDDEMFNLVSKNPTPERVVTKVKKPSMPFELPALSLISGKAESKSKPVDKNWYLEKANILVEKLKDFGVDGEVVHISPGPVITVYEFKPASGVKIKEIANLSDDLTLALSVLSVRIVAPIPGKPVVGIEIPSPHREIVFFKDLVQETPFFKPEIRIPIALGRLASGEPVTADLAAMPHLLVAGSTGTGKSVFINSLIASLLYRFTPQQLKLILVDPKMVELSLYEGIPHLLLPVVVDSKKAALALRWAVDEMERRYTLMHQTGVRHVDAYNERLYELQGGPSEDRPFMPYIVIVIDEYADLMAVVPKDVELSIARLAQKARASGIHLVLATQRPSTDVVTGTIKANFPSRISFRVASSVDSKTILDRTGADRLLGQGDLLFHSAGFTTLKRMQGAFINENDTANIVDYLKSQGEPEYDARVLKSLEESEDAQGMLPIDGDANNEESRLYDAAVRLVTEKGEASISLIQRHLRIGYNRAATLMEQLEKEGVVAQSTGPSKRRAVLVNQI